MQNFLQSFPLAALLKASWQAGVLILLVLAVQWAFRDRLSPRLRYGLWLLVVARLALPWTIPSGLSLFNVLNFSRAGAALAELHSDANSAGSERAVGEPNARVKAAPSSGRFAINQL